MNKDTKPRTGEKADSQMTSMLKRLSKSKPEQQMPKLPEPTFDRYLGGLFKNRKK